MINWEHFKIRKNESPRPEGCSCAWTLDPGAGEDRYLVTTNPTCTLHGWNKPAVQTPTKFEEGEEWLP